MGRKIIGATVGTTMNPEKILERAEYKTLVDVTLDDTNSGANKVMAELPLEDFKKCKEFTIYVEIPSYTTKDVYVTGYLTNRTESAYTLAVLYNYGRMDTNQGKTFRLFSIVKILDGNYLSITGAGSSYTGVNSSLSGVRSAMSNKFVYPYDDYPPYLRITTGETTLPSGTRIIMEGR